jgi:hypothetical protein
MIAPVSTSRTQGVVVKVLRATDTIQSVHGLGRIRMQTMQAFLDNYDLGKRQGHYVDGELPSIAFSDKSFDLAVCSHFLFLYTEHLSEAFHKSRPMVLSKARACRQE